MYRHFFLNRGVMIMAFILAGLAAMAQPGRDTTRPRGATTGPRPYKEIITDKARTDDGLFKVHRIEDKYFLEIPDSLFMRDILVVNRISKAAAGMRIGGFFGYGGDQIGQNVIRFEKGPNNRVFVVLPFISFS